MLITSTPSGPSVPESQRAAARGMRRKLSLSVEKAIHGLFPIKRPPKKPSFFGGAPVAASCGGRLVSQSATQVRCSRKFGEELLGPVDLVEGLEDGPHIHRHRPALLIGIDIRR